ncbi:MAG TPA: histidine kinase [Cellulomonas sp.]
MGTAPPPWQPQEWPPPSGTRPPGRAVPPIGRPPAPVAAPAPAPVPVAPGGSWAVPGPGVPGPVPVVRRSPSGRRWALEIWLQAACLFSMTASVAYASEAASGTSRTGPGYLLAWLVGVGVCATVALRRRYPVLATVVTGTAAVLLPFDALGVLIAVPWVIARRPERTAWLCGGLAGLAVTASLTRDALRPAAHAVFSVADQVTGVHESLTPVGYAGLGLLLLTVSVAWGLVRRSREAAARSAQAELVQAAAVHELRAELSRQDERDLIARELHDTVAHHLSVVSLRASALEVSADGGEVQDAARSMRASAHQALEEMRDLIALLRDAQVAITPGPMPGRTLAELPELLAAARDGGADISATVFVSDGASAPATLTRAVYRIVQEALTNALKHAPGTRVDLDVRAAPGDGVHLRVRNALAPAGVPAPPVPSVPGSGTGLVGMRERAATVRGTVEAGPDGATWLVVVHLPWPARPGPSPTIGA